MAIKEVPCEVYILNLISSKDIPCKIITIDFTE